MGKKTVPVAAALSCINDGKTLKTRITAFVKTHSKHLELAHVLVVSAIKHAGRHGDPRPLTDLYNGFNTNEQTSLKQYLRFIHRDHPETEFIGFAKGEFIAKADTDKARAAMVELCDEALINPDGEKYKRFYERNNIASVVELGNSQFMGQIKSLLNKAMGKNENVHATVAPELVRVLSKAVETMETIADANVPVPAKDAVPPSVKRPGRARKANIETAAAA